MYIQEITLSGLQDFLNSEVYTTAKEIPITFHRAQSQMKNPRADAEDVLLIVAYNENSELIGYVGALPDSIKGKYKVTWNSCWYVNDKKGKTLALPLFLRFVKAWKGKILLRDLTSHTKKIIEKLPYFQAVKTEHKTRYFATFYLASLLPEKWPVLSFLKVPLQFLDFILNSCLKVIQFIWKKQHALNSSFSLKLVTQIDDQIVHFIDSNNKEEIIQRGKDELDWIMNYPWVVEKTNENGDLASRYFFSSIARSFNYYRLQINHYSNLIAFLIVKEREFHFEIPYFYMNEEYSEEICLYIVNFLYSKQIRSLTITNTKLKKGLEKIKFPYFYSRTQNGEFYVSKELIHVIGNDPELQDGDGDVAFT